MIIYCITNSVNGMRYIGAAKSFKERKQKHLSDARRGKGREGSIQDAMRSFGEENFRFEVIDEAEDYASLSEREHYWIQKFNSLSPNGYNLLLGNYATKVKNNFRHVSVEINGKKFKTIKSAAQFYGVTESCFRNRLDRGCTLEQAAGLTDLPEEFGVQETFVPITIGGNYFRCKADAARHFGIKVGTLHARMRRGCTPEQAVGVEPIPEKRFLHPNMSEVTIFGKTFDSRKQAFEHYSKKIGVKARTLKARYDAGWSWEDILSPEISNRQRVLRKAEKEYTAFGKTYRTSAELGGAFGVSASYIRVLMCRNKGKSLEWLISEKLNKMEA